MKFSNLFFVVLVWVLNGCASTAGKDFDPSNIGNIKNGQSTMPDVVASLGSPLSKNVSVDGTEIWIYQFVRTIGKPKLNPFALPDMEKNEKRVTITFRKGVVTDCVYMTFSNKNTAEQNVLAAGVGVGETKNIRCSDFRR